VEEEWEEGNENPGDSEVVVEEEEGSEAESLALPGSLELEIGGATLKPVNDDAVGKEKLVEAEVVEVGKEVLVEVLLLELESEEVVEEAGELVMTSQMDFFGFVEGEEVVEVVEEGRGVRVVRLVNTRFEASGVVDFASSGSNSCPSFDCSLRPNTRFFRRFFDAAAGGEEGSGDGSDEPNPKDFEDSVLEGSDDVEAPNPKDFEGSEGFAEPKTELDEEATVEENEGNEGFSEGREEGSLGCDG